MRGWERVTPTDIARLGAQPKPAQALKQTRQKYRAEPCIVTPDGTLFTTADIATAEVAAGLPARHEPLKFRAERCGLRGRWFASLKEGRRYLELTLLERAGAIQDLHCQVGFDLTVVSTVDGRAHYVGKWTADFEYRRDGKRVVEDTKSTATRTEAYQLRKKIFQALYGLEILET